MAFLSRIQELKLRIAEHEHKLQDLRKELDRVESEANLGNTQAQDASNVTSDVVANWRWPLTTDEYRRYGRQMILPEIGLQGAYINAESHDIRIAANFLARPALPKIRLGLNRWRWRTRMPCGILPRRRWRG